MADENSSVNEIQTDPSNTQYPADTDQAGEGTTDTFGGPDAPVTDEDPNETRLADDGTVPASTDAPDDQFES